MSLTNLTASGWVLFAVTLILLFGFVNNLVHRQNSAAAQGAVCLAICTVWLLYLVTP